MFYNADAVLVKSDVQKAHCKKHALTTAIIVFFVGSRFVLIISPNDSLAQNDLCTILLHYKTNN